jgi:hypothetical protein
MVMAHLRHAGVTEPPTLDFTIRPALVLRVLLACILVMLLAGTTVAVSISVFNHRSLFRLGPLFHMDSEHNIPAFFSALELLLAASLLAVLALGGIERDRRLRRGWALLATGFLSLAFDEAVEIHERLNGPIRRLLGEPDFAAAWLVPSVFVLAAAAILLLPFLHALPWRFALMFAASGGLYLLGAVVLEAIGGEIQEHLGQGALAYQLEVVAEEACEMLGVALFIYGILSYIADRGLAVTFRTGRPGPPRYP